MASSYLPFVGATDAADEDREAFASLYKRQAPRIHRFLRDLLGETALASDATQETFARAYRSKKDLLADPERAVPWLFGVARNVSLELRKARARHNRWTPPSEGEADSPESDLLGREAASVVNVALGKMSEDRRAVLLLRLDHGLAYEDIAKTMGFSLAKVKVEIHRAREVLRETLEAYRRGERR